MKEKGGERKEGDGKTGRTGRNERGPEARDGEEERKKGRGEEEKRRGETKEAKRDEEGREETGGEERRGEERSGKGLWRKGRVREGRRTNRLTDRQATKQAGPHSDTSNSNYIYLHPHTKGLRITRVRTFIAGLFLKY